MLNLNPYAQARRLYSSCGVVVQSQIKEGHFLSDLNQLIYNTVNTVFVSVVFPTRNGQEIWYPLDLRTSDKETGYFLGGSPILIRYLDQKITSLHKLHLSFISRSLTTQGLVVEGYRGYIKDLRVVVRGETLYTSTCEQYWDWGVFDD